MYTGSVQELERTISGFIRDELNTYKKHLTKRNAKYDGDVKDDKWSLRQAVLNMTHYFLKKMEHEDVADALQYELIGIQQCTLKFELSKKCHYVCEGIAQQGESTVLNKIYTELYITEGGAGQVNKDHEDKPIRTVLTQGVAGIGKSICVQKFILDWAEEAPLDVVMTNLIKGNLLPSARIWITTRPAAAARIPAEYVHRMTELRGFNDEQKEQYFRKRISDPGLAEKIINHIRESRSLHIMCHIPVFCWISATVLQRILQAAKSEDTPKTLTDMYTSFLIFQTVQGNLKYTGHNASDVPWDTEGILSMGKLAFHHLEESNLIFYTEDLEACGIDPSKISVYSGLCTQETVRFLGTVFSFVHLSIQEFLAALFAYISLRNDNKNVLEKCSTSQDSNETDITEFLKTAVDKALDCGHGQMDLFLRFLLGLSLESNEKLIRGLLTQKGRRSDSQKDIVEYIKLKFKENPSPERSINLFYCLNELNDDSLVKEIQSYMSSGHLSEAELSPALWSALVFVLLTSKEKIDVFDLKKFIRSDECLTRLLPVVKEATSALSESSKLTALDLSSNPIQDRGVELLSAGLESPNCELEKLRLNGNGITEESCAALASALHSNPLYLRKLDLSGNKVGKSGMEKLGILLGSPKCKLDKLGLSDCSITEEGWTVIVSAVEKNPTYLKELDLSKNKIEGSGLDQVSTLLKNPKCVLDTLKLSDCHITGDGYAALALALKSNPSSNLKELDLRRNNPGDNGVEMLADLLQDEKFKLETLRLLKSSEAEEACSSLTDVLRINPLLQTELDLKGKIQGDSQVKQLSLLLGDSHCRLRKLNLSDCRITGEGYAALASALELNPSSHLIELDLRGNDPGATGVAQLTKLRNDPKYKLESLRLLKSDDAVQAHAFLSEHLKQEPLLLNELNLRNMKPDSTKMKQLSALLVDSHCKAKTLGLKCELTEDSCEHLATALISKDSELTELNLSNSKLGHSSVQKISTALKNPTCKLKILRLSDCSVGEEGYTALASALDSNSSSHLKELDLRGNNPGASGVERIINTSSGSKPRKIRLLKNSDADAALDSLTTSLNKHPLLLTEMDLRTYTPQHAGVKEMCGVLEDSHCRLKTFKLYTSGSITERDCADLVSALIKNPSHLRELDLNQNKLDKSGVQKLCDLLQNPHCKLEKLKLSNCSITEEGWTVIVSAVDKNPTHLTELDLSKNKIEGPRLIQLSTLLKNAKCVLDTLKLNECELTEDSCEHLATALISKDSKLTELNLSNSELGGSSVQKISTALKNPTCKLEILRLSDCSVGEEGYAALASALNSNSSSHLKELDLRGNNPGDTGVQRIINTSSKSKPRKIRLLKNSDADAALDSLTKSLNKHPLLLTEMDLRTYTPQQAGVKEMCGVLEDSHCRLKALKLYKSGTIKESDCADLISALIKNPSHLRELDLNQNKLDESGLQNLCALLQDPHCKLEKLKLSDCHITGDGYTALALALKSNSSSNLIELDLRGNSPGDNGVELLAELLQDTNCKLKTLRLLKSSEAEEACSSLTVVLDINPLLQTELDLKGKIQGDSQVRQLSLLLKDPHCRLQKLNLSDCRLTGKGYAALASALELNPSSHLMELDLRGNDPGDTGVAQLTKLRNDPKYKLESLRLNECELTEDSCKHLATALISKDSKLTELNLSNSKLRGSSVQKISTALKNPNCKLKILRLSDCSVGEEGYAALASALNSNSSSHLKELDLRGNNPGASGVQRIINTSSGSKPRKIRLLKNSDADAALDSLTKTLKKHPLLLTEMDLTKYTSSHVGVKGICGVLEDSHCRLKTFKLYKSESIKGSDCADLISALIKNPSHLRELDLNENKLDESGLQKLCALLQDPDCKLEELKLSNCSIKGEGYTALASALSNPSSHLRELDLRGNDPGDTGVEKLTTLLKDSHCKLTTLRLLEGAGAIGICESLTKALGINPLLLRELDLNGKIQGDSEIKKLSDLVKDLHCRTQKLKLKKSGITEKGCVSLLSALNLNPSHLIELDLSENKIGNSGVKHISDLLKKSDCKLEKLSLLNSPAAEEVCDSLTKVLGTNPLLLKELDLSGKIQEDIEMKKISDLLADLHCRTQILKLTGLSKCSATDCAALSSALRSNPSHLTELDLSENNLGNSGLKKICSLLKDQSCKLQSLGLLNSKDAEEAYSCLQKLLKEDPLLLKGLDLSKREPTDIQVKQLSALLKDPHFRLKKLTLYKSGSITGRDCADLISALTVNPSHLRELDMNQNELDKSGVQMLCTLLQNPHCKLEKLKLNTCSIGEEGCADLTSALTSNPSHLRELDLRGNSKLGESVKDLSDLLQKSGCTLQLDSAIWGKFKGVWSWRRGDSTKSKTKDGALPAQTGEEETGGQQMERMSQISH
ncbi:hypothetical protein NFI96_006103 [Prochilodus magdalenae]|nr:hypothetical protein NFI96_006103 [Prochilodus magdalenae]